jgi:predicted metal-dependent hydrolase
VEDEDIESATALEWKLRVSPRARYAKLLIRPFGGLEVVIPKRFPRNQVPGLVAKHETWARRQLARQSKLRQSIRLPQYLSLAFDNSATPVIYQADSLQFNFELFEEQSTDQIVVRATGHQERVRELRSWIRRRARESFPALLTQISTRTGLRFNKMSVRSQKTRWGSCSRRGNISLNDQLLFLPAKTGTLPHASPESFESVLGPGGITLPRFQSP